MIDMRQRKLTFGLLALGLIFAGCKGESPTAPPPLTSTQPPTTGGAPTGVAITLAVSNANPLVNSTSTISATVTQNNQTVPNGTAVQFTTNLGTFNDPVLPAATVIRTTTSGVATAVLTSAGAGAATVTVTVGNVSKTTTVTFTSQPVTPTPPSTTPTISSISPTFGRPEGGDQVTITGTNFRTPVRVLFDPGNNTTPKEAFVVSVAPTQIVILTPPFNVAAGSSQAVDVVLINEAGAPTETRLVKSAGFTYVTTALTPAILAVQPTSGPIGGGTRVTISGNNFQSHVQVFFNAAEAQVINVTFSQIIVMSPRASDTAPGGSGTVTGPVTIRVLNVDSGKDATLAGAFRYTPKMQITTAGPTEGPFTGGTRITIDGVGFDDPLAVVVAGVGAQVIRVAGSEVIAITNGVLVTGCADVKGPITVTNTENGDSADGPVFTFRVPKPAVVTVTSPVSIGGSTNVTVLNAFGLPRITIGGTAAQITGQTTNPDGTVTFTVIVPSTLRLDTQACSTVPGVNAQQPTAFDVTYLSVSSGCTDTFAHGLIVNPAGPIIAVSPAAGFTPFQATSANPAAVPPTPATPAPAQTVTITNAGNGTLTVNSVTTSGAGCAQFTITNPTPPVGLAQCDPFPVQANYNRTAPAGASDTCTVTVGTSAGNRAFTLSGSVK